MAKIFGQNGLSAAALYLATLWAVYGQKDAGYPDKQAIEKVRDWSQRKAQSLKDKKGAEYKAEVAKLREARHAAYLARGIARTGAKGRERYADQYAKSSKFDVEQRKLGYLR